VQDLRFELWRKMERVMCIEPTLVVWQNRRQWPLPESLRCATEGPLLAYAVEKLGFPLRALFRRQSIENDNRQ